MSDDDNERLRNMLFYKMYATDKEIAEAGPYAIIIVLVALLGVLLFACL